VGPARPPHLSTGIIGNVFKPFMNTFHVQLAPIFLGAQFPKRLAPGARPVQEQPPQAATLFVRRDRGSRVRDRIGQCSPSNQTLRLPPRALAVTSQERGAAQEGLGSGTIASYSVAIPAAMIANTSCKPGNSWFQKSAPIEYFYRFLCRAEFRCWQLRHRSRWSAPLNV
jgi:hypothetical protein